LVKFFSNKNSKSYLRNLASEFNESTNSIRVELNRLSDAGYLKSKESGRTILYQANEKHPIFSELQAVVRKYLGLDKLVSDLVEKLGDVKMAFVTGDYALGKDTGIIDLALVGNIDQENLNRLVKKVEKLIRRRIRYLIIEPREFKRLKKQLHSHEAIWLWGEE
jgi:DNA-binding transcriptional ArsR family regulator